MKSVLLQPRQINLKRRLSVEDLRFNIKHIKQIVFELTERCNLACRYCTYGRYYQMAPERKLLDIKWEYIKNVVDYIYAVKDSGSELYVGFYGGEPLLKFDLIKKTIDYCQTINRKGIKFLYGMTTNGVLLHKYADYLVENNFSLLISLDGDRQANSFRVFHNGEESFDVVYKNVKKIASDYPTYFKKQVKFNAVLHQKNNIPGINRFFQEQFQKAPMIASLSTDNLHPLYEAEFVKDLYKNYTSDFENFKSMKVVEGQVKQNAYLSNALRLLSNRNPLFVKDYNELLSPELYPEKEQSYIPTATCMPLADKIFITVQGKILPCERINHKYQIGSVSGEAVSIDFEYIVKKYNSYYDKMEPICNVCAYKDNCQNCMFTMDLDVPKIQCPAFATQKKMENEVDEIFEYLNEYPDELYKIIYEIYDA